MTNHWQIRAGGGLNRRIHFYDNIISPENLLEAWKEFLKGKRGKRDVQEFQMNLMDNILDLHRDLARREYRHGDYHAFNISDPKPRNIHKASVRDRLLHHAVYRVLYPFFDSKFIHDSYSCRANKGTHKAMKRFESFFRKESANNTRTCWVLKCDVKKFFASVDHQTLMSILEKHLLDPDTTWLFGRIIESFHSGVPGRGLPLGNLTSQLLVNIYMNEFDQYAKHKLKAKHYIRYADDFVILSKDKSRLEADIQFIDVYLKEKLKLELHPDKVFIKTFASGVDFLGWVHFPDHRVLRRATKQRMMRNMAKAPSKETRASYLGMLKWGNGHKIKRRMGFV